MGNLNVWSQRVHQQSVLNPSRVTYMQPVWFMELMALLSRGVLLFKAALLTFVMSHRDPFCLDKTSIPRACTNIWLFSVLVLIRIQSQV